MDMVNQNINKADGDWGLVHETSKGLHAVLAPGSNLDNMNRVMLSIMEDYLNEFGKGESTIDLYGWLRPRVTVASTEAIYGPGNPFKRQPELESDFW